mmetsp:Transcript_19431/g.61120  ORF Transcript_19431/g.61120 Transcript_19431/m.61120 type:complete len:95 (+) Transcript_19431:1271-1555(+)
MAMTYGSVAEKLRVMRTVFDDKYRDAPTPCRHLQHMTQTTAVALPMTDWMYSAKEVKSIATATQMMAQECSDTMRRVRRARLAAQGVVTRALKG